MTKQTSKIKTNMQFFTEKDLLNQQPASLKKG